MIALAWEGRAPGATEIAFANFERGCDADDSASCRQLAARWSTIQPETAAIYRKRACNLGDRESCVAAPNTAVASPPAAPPAGPAADAPRPDAPAVVSGTCFFVARAGIAVTNRHVVDGAATVALIDARGRVHAAKVMRDDKDVDLAILEAVTARDVAPLPLARDADVPLGEPVFTIGFPVPGVLGNDPKFSEGSLGGQTGLGAAWLYQVTVPVQPGNSGGPLVDHRGLVVGVIVAKLRADRLLVEEGVAPENVNFAIKSVELRRMLRGLPLSSAKAARTRQAAITRTEASVCHVIATPAAPSGPAAGDVVAPPPAPAANTSPKVDAPAGPTSPPAAGPTDQQRISGDPHIYPDTATVNEMRRVGLNVLRVSVEVCIATSGEVTGVSIPRSSGYPAYDAKLAQEIARWRYSPRTSNQPDPNCRVITFKYRVADHEASGGAAPGQVPPGTGAGPGASPGETEFR
jgi:TonB family protein